jgi:hypothetical protein
MPPSACPRSETYVHVGFGRFAWVATCADSQQPMQTPPVGGPQGCQTS